MEWLNIIISIFVMFTMLAVAGIVFVLSNIESFIDWLDKKDSSIWKKKI